MKGFEDLRKELKKTNSKDFHILEESIVRNNHIKPSTKALAVTILFKMKNQLPLNSREKRIYKEVSSTV